MNIDITNGVEYFMDALPVIGTGYLGIFIVIGIIILAVYLINWLFRSRD